jgi:hypothetical protein
MFLVSARRLTRPRNGLINAHYNPSRMLARGLTN